MHSDVDDVVVCGRPSERWVSEVVAIVQLVDGARLRESEIIEHCGTKIAQYKRPKAVLQVENIQRSPAGKPDYRWAKAIAQDSSGS